MRKVIDRTIGLGMLCALLLFGLHSTSLATDQPDWISRESRVEGDKVTLIGTAEGWFVRERQAYLYALVEIDLLEFHLIDVTQDTDSLYIDRQGGEFGLPDVVECRHMLSILFESEQSESMQKDETFPGNYKEHEEYTGLSSSGIEAKLYASETYVPSKQEEKPFVEQRTEMVQKCQIQDPHSLLIQLPIVDQFIQELPDGRKRTFVQLEGSLAALKKAGLYLKKPTPDETAEEKKK